ncbi:MAG: hypothetical protein Q9227_008972 [Pyrenula ochraceoflavens]
MEEGVVQNSDAEKLPKDPPTTPTSTGTSSFYQSASSIRRLLRPHLASLRSWKCPPLWPAWTSWKISSVGAPPARTRPDFSVTTLEECPSGYPRLAAFLDSDEGFSIFRRFGYVQARLVLEKQDEMRRLEQEMITQKMMAFNRPASSDYQSVVNYVSDQRPVATAERAWVYWKEDMITLRPGREHAWLDSGIEHILKWLHCSAVEYLFCSKETKLKSSDPNAIYYTRERIERLVVCIIVFMILVLLVVPIYVLYHLVNDEATNKAYALSIGVLLIFTLAFSAMLSLFTRARRHEIFGAAAA